MMSRYVRYQDLIKSLRQLSRFDNFLVFSGQQINPSSSTNTNILFVDSISLIIGFRYCYCIIIFSKIQKIRARPELLQEFTWTKYLTSSDHCLSGGSGASYICIQQWGVK
jgi:hypothetical protein